MHFCCAVTSLRVTTEMPLLQRRASMWKLIYEKEHVDLALLTSLCLNRSAISTSVVVYVVLAFFFFFFFKYNCNLDTPLKRHV